MNFECQILASTLWFFVCVGLDSDNAGKHRSMYFRFGLYQDQKSQTENIKCNGSFSEVQN